MPDDQQSTPPDLKPPTAQAPDDDSQAQEPGRQPQKAVPSPQEESAGENLFTPDVEKEVAAALGDMSIGDVADLETHTAQDVSDVPPEQLEPGTPLSGTIVHVGDDDIMIEFGPRLQGVLPRAHFPADEAVAAGSKVDVLVDEFDSKTGLLKVSRKGFTQKANWRNLVKGMIVEGRVTGLNRGGLEIDVQGIRAFMPASQVDLVPLKDISILLNDTVRAEVIELDRRGKNVLVSRRRLLEKERAARRDETLETLEAGQVRKGVVSNIADYGAFVDIGGVDGLLHISDLSWGQVNKVSDVLTVGQEVEVKVLKVNREKERISLGLKQAQPDPWENIAQRYDVGTNVKGRIVRIVDFGAFAEIEPGVDALIPVSELGWTHVKRPRDVLAEGDMVDAVVIRVEPERRRIALSVKQAQPDPWEGLDERFPASSEVTGKVTRITDFGAFIELAPAIEGLAHISELSTQRVRTPGDVVQVGQEVNARVLSIDTEQRRIALSLKPADAGSHAPQHEDDSRGKTSRKRKKPLRGGLSSGWDFFSNAAN